MHVYSVLCNIIAIVYYAIKTRYAIMYKYLFFYSFTCYNSKNMHSLVSL